jgi:hypothetical protein
MRALDPRAYENRVPVELFPLWKAAYVKIGVASLVFGASLLVSAFLNPSLAQEGAFAFQIRGGGGIPLASFASEDAGWQRESGAGSSFAIGFTLPAPGPLGSYLGFSQHRFSCAEEVCSTGSKWIATGFDVDLRKVMGEGGVRFWVQGGLHPLRVEGSEAVEGGEAVPLVSDFGLGLEAGGGVLIGIGERTSLSPGVRYGWGRVPFRERDDMELHYLILDLGVVLGF